MQSRSRLQNGGLAIVMILTIGLVTTPCLAQEQQSESADESDAAETDSPSTSSTRSETADTDVENPEAEPATRFTPTEKIGAADTVSLPVDI